ncbi:MAG: anti-sigma factor family protein [Limisphaerales bacterium]
MKWFLNPCRRHRESLCLLASGLLPEVDRIGIENHLAECASCLIYYEEIKAVTAPLAGWEKHFAHIEPGLTVQKRLAKAIAVAGKPGSVRPLTPELALRECWQQLVWPCRHFWSGLAAVWIFILAANISMQDHSQTTMAKAAPTTGMIMALKDQQKILAELLGDRTPLPDADRQKIFSPKPRTERVKVLTA